jgi:hypothetical protein
VFLNFEHFFFRESAKVISFFVKAQKTFALYFIEKKGFGTSLLGGKSKEKLQRIQ